jgi:hypothetical protein
VDGGLVAFMSPEPLALPRGGAGRAAPLLLLPVETLHGYEYRGPPCDS